MKKVVIATTLILGLISPGFLYATPPDKEIILAFSTGGWPPYLISDQKGISGFMYDILQIIALKSGYEVVIRNYPSKRSALMLDQGRVDVRAKAKEWVKNPEKYTWTDPVVQSEDQLVFLKEKPLIFNDIKDLFHKRIGTRLGYGYPLLNSFFDSKQIIRVDTVSESAILLMLMKKRTDAAIMNKYVALWTMKQHPQLAVKKFGFSKKNIGKAGYRFMFTNKHDWKPFAKLFNQELAKLKANGSLEKIISKYK